MSRRPINVELRGLKTPRERVWDAILLLDAGKGNPFDKTTVQDHCKPMVSWTLVDDYFDDLEKAGYFKRVGGTGVSKGVMGRPIQFVLAAKAKRQGEAPRISVEGEKVTQGDGNEAMWRAMKVLPTFDYTDIAKAATMRGAPKIATLIRTAIAAPGFSEYRTSNTPFTNVWRAPPSGATLSSMPAIA